jgi:hypothetical protein
VFFGVPFLPARQPSATVSSSGKNLKAGDRHRAVLLDSIGLVISMQFATFS